MKSLLLAAAYAAAPAVAYAGAATPAAAPAPTVVEIHNMHFNPPEITVAAGTKVTWVNDDELPHTVTEQSRAFHSSALDTKDSFSYIFATPGDFTYFCTLHPMMRGKITVKAAGHRLNTGHVIARSEATKQSPAGFARWSGDCFAALKRRRFGNMSAAA